LFDVLRYKKAVREANEQRESDGKVTITSAYCNAHARRCFMDGNKPIDRAAQFMIDKYAECQAIENSSKGKAPVDVISIRQQLVHHFEDMKAYAEDQLSQFSDKSDMVKACNYFLGNFKGLTYFINDAETPLENNQSERLLRSSVVGRKTWYGTHSRRGARTASIHLTLIENCKLIGLNPRIYYKESVARHHKGLATLTPYQMKMAIDRGDLVPQSSPPVHPAKGP
jgi:transposase